MKELKESQALKNTLSDKYQKGMLLYFYFSTLKTSPCLVIKEVRETSDINIIDIFVNFYKITHKEMCKFSTKILLI